MHVTPVEGRSDLHVDSLGECSVTAFMLIKPSAA